MSVLTHAGYPACVLGHLVDELQSPGSILPGHHGRLPESRWHEHRLLRLQLRRLVVQQRHAGLEPGHQDSRLHGRHPNTIIVAEQSGKVDNASGNGPPDLRNGYYSPWGSITNGSTNGVASCGTGGCGDLWGDGLTCSAYSINNKTAPAGAGFTWGGNTILNSAHPGGINALMTDGTVRYVRDSIDFVTFQRACSRNDGQTISLD